VPVPRGPHDLLQGGQARSPSQVLPGLVCRGHQDSRIPRAARAFADLDGASAHRGADRGNLPHRKPFTISQVEGVGLAFTQQGQGPDMGFRQVGDMDVVPDRGAVGSRVVGPEELNLRLAIQRSHQQTGDEVRFAGTVVLSYPPAGIGAGGVEIAQRDIRKTMGVVVGGQGFLEGQLGIPIRVGGQLGMFLGDGDFVPR